MMSRNWSLYFFTFYSRLIYSAEAINWRGAIFCASQGFQILSLLSKESGAMTPFIKLALLISRETISWRKLPKRGSLGKTLLAEMTLVCWLRNLFYSVLSTSEYLFIPQPVVYLFVRIFLVTKFCPWPIFSPMDNPAAFHSSLFTRYLILAFYFSKRSSVNWNMIDICFLSPNGQMFHVLAANAQWQKMHFKANNMSLPLIWYLIPLFLFLALSSCAFMQSYDVSLSLDLFVMVDDLPNFLVLRLANGLHWIDRNRLGCQMSPCAHFLPHSGRIPLSSLAASESPFTFNFAGREGGMANYKSSQLEHLISSHLLVQNELRRLKAQLRSHSWMQTWCRGNPPTGPRFVQGPEDRTLDRFATLILIFSYIPASNLVFYVGFVLAERVLYMPRWASVSIVRRPSSIERVGKDHQITIRWNFLILPSQAITFCFFPRIPKSIGLSLLISHGFTRLIQSRSQITALVGKILFAILIVSQGLRTCQRNQDWQSRDALLR